MTLEQLIVEANEAVIKNPELLYREVLIRDSDGDIYNTERTFTQGLKEEKHFVIE